MGESYNHVELVRQIIEWVRCHDAHSIIFADSSIEIAAQKPPKIGGHIPDVYARTNNLQNIIIGEAKTRKDLENEHTMSQFKAFLNYCSVYPEARLVLAIPWDMRIFVHNLFNRLCRETRLSVKSVEILHCFIV